jgi:hypothetical protein
MDEPQVTERSEGADVIPLRPAAEPERWDGGRPTSANILAVIDEVERQLDDGRSVQQVVVKDQTGQRFGFAEVPVTWSPAEANDRFESYAKWNNFLRGFGERLEADASAALERDIAALEVTAEELDDDLAHHSPGPKVRDETDLGDHGAFTASEYGRVHHELKNRTRALRSALSEVESHLADYNAVREAARPELTALKTIRSQPELESRLVEVLRSILSGGPVDLAEFPPQTFARPDVARLTKLRSQIQRRLNECAAAYRLLRARDADFEGIEEEAFDRMAAAFPAMRTRRPTVIRPADFQTG